MTEIEQLEEEEIAARRACQADLGVDTDVLTPRERIEFGIAREERRAHWEAVGQALFTARRNAQAVDQQGDI